jgi:peptide/nickel transport system permease protein
VAVEPGGAAVNLRRLPRTRAWYTDVWIQLVRHKPLGTLGAVIVIVMLGGAVLADVITPYGFAETNLRERFAPISREHWLGADPLGRDLLTRLLYGARVSLYVGFGAVSLGCLIATFVGIGSAYFGGRVDLLLQRAVDAWMAFPPLLLLMSIMSLVGPGAWNITIVLGTAFGIQNSRIVRSMALSIKENTYIEGARAAGAGHVRITAGHILPNVLPTIIVVATTGLSTVILTEASLSFLGLGVPPPYPTWGGMLSLAGLDHMYRAPGLAIWPAVALSLAVFGFNMLGDALRDLLDPRLKGG